MFRLKVNKSGGRDYLSVVSSYWDPVIKNSRTKTIKSFGYLEKLKEEFADPISHFKTVVDEMNSELAAKNAEFNIKCDIDALISDSKAHRKNLGYSALSEIYHELGLDVLFSNRSRAFNNEYSINQIMMLLIYSQILSPGSKKKAFESKGIYFEKMDFSLEDIYRCLTQVNTFKDVIPKSLNNKMKQLYNRKSEIVYYDVTNYYFEIDSEDDLRKKGASKEHRPDPIVQLGLFVDSNKIPITYRLFPGNTHDSKTLIPLVSELKKDFGINKAIVVADKGLNSGDNIAFNTVIEKGYVFSQKIRGANKELKDYVFDEKGYRVLNEDFKLKSRIAPTEITITNNDNKKVKVSIDQKQVIIYSKKYADKARQNRESVVEKAHMLIKSPSSYNRATSYGAAKYVKNLTFDQTTGEILYSKQKPVFDEEKLKEDERYDGYYAIITSELDKTDEEILDIYKGLWQIEEAFKVTKTDLRSRPVYLSRQDRIEAHFLICFISLYIVRLLAYKLDNKYSISKIISSLNKMSYSFIAQNLYVGNYSDEITIAIKDKLNIDLDRKFITLGEIRKIIGDTKKRSNPQGL